MTFRTRPSRLTFLSLIVLTVFFTLSPLPSFAQEGALDKSEPKGTPVPKIIKRFAAKEKEFKDAPDQYTFRRQVKVMPLDRDAADGVHQQVCDVTFDDKGRKIKNVVYAPQ